MTSKQNTSKPLKINRRPKDALSDNEEEVEEMKNTYDTVDNDAKKSKNTMSIWIWMDWPGGEHYYGCLGQQSYSFAVAPDDLIIAYNYANMDKDWFIWLTRITKLSPSQFIWIQSKNIPTFDDMATDLLTQIALTIERKLIDNPSLQIRLKPFAMTPASNKIINTIKSQISVVNKDNIITCAANPTWAEKFANKACLHRHMATLDKPSLFEECDVYGIDGLTECKGYVCKSKEELLAAYDKLTKEIGRTRVVIKDCWGVSGDDITFCNSKQEVIDKFTWRKELKLMNMEEDLRYINGDNDNQIPKIHFVGCQFYDNKVLGVADQIILDDKSYGGSITYSDKEIAAELKRITAEVMKRIGTKYMGGFDFAIQRFEDKSIKPKIYLIDMNTARYTAPMQSFIVMNKFGVKDKYFIRKNLVIKRAAKFKEILEENSDVLFDEERKVGAYFNMFHPEDKVSIVSVIGNDERDANDRLSKLKSIKTLCP